MVGLRAERAKEASGASTPEYDGKFDMKSLNGLGVGGSLEGWARTRSGGCRSRASSARSAALNCLRASRTWQERGDPGCALEDAANTAAVCCVGARSHLAMMA